MRTITTTNVRKCIKDLIDLVKETGEVVAIERHDNLEALIIKFPKDYNKKLSDITNINAYSSSFDFLADEPDLYTRADLRKKHD